jgi:hypothetical protein
MLACYVVNTNSEDGSGKKMCAPMLEDYYECLHHRKEVRYFHLTTKPTALSDTDDRSTTGRSCPRSPIRIPQAPRRKPQRRRPHGRSNKESGLDRRRPPLKGHEGRCFASSRQDKLNHLSNILYHRNYFSFTVYTFSLWSSELLEYRLDLSISSDIKHAEFPCLVISFAV